jgi:hypothetical protein
MPKGVPPLLEFDAELHGIIADFSSEYLQSQDKSAKTRALRKSP